MKHSIDPKVDCVFKAILGDEDHTHLLIHFLNALLLDELQSPIVSVEILNPYNDKELLDEKLSIVDIKARDQAFRLYQIEIQLRNYRNIPARMAYTWADIYSKQLKEGDNYLELKPTYSIWLLGEKVKNDDKYLHIIKMRDQTGEVLLENGGIWLLELPKFNETTVKTELERWLKLFKEGDQLDDTRLPDWMHTPEMEQVMTVLNRFSEKESDYHLYQTRQNFQREQKTIQLELEEALREKMAALREKKAALKEKEAEKKAREEERKEKEAERQAKEAALQREEAERQAKEEALKENEAMKAELAKIKAQMEQATKK